jgi:hypothetical protein
MAKGKSSAPSLQNPANLPAVYRRAEPIAFLKEEKARILKRFSFQHRSINQQRDFAICLIALGRFADALQMLDFAHRNIQFRGSHYVWYGAATACCVSAYLRRKKGQETRAIRDLQRFLEPPCHAIVSQTDVWTAAFVRKHLAQERSRFACWYDDPELTAAIEARAWWIATLVFFREFALLGFPKKGTISVERLDLGIEQALEELAAKLHREERQTHA